MGDEPPHGPSPGGFQAQGVPENNREAPTSELGNLLGMTTLGGGYAGVGFRRGGGIHLEEE